MRPLMRLLPPQPRPTHLHSPTLHLQHQRINLATLRGKRAIQRKGPGHIRSIAIVLGARVNQQIQLVRQRQVIARVMQGGAVAAGGDDRVVGLLVAALGDAFGQEQAVQVLLVGRVLGGADDGFVRDRADAVGVSHERDFVRVFAHPAVVDGGSEEREVG